MSEAFDPYYKWLAIPPKDQPPNYYRLLAIELFESDRDVIANAADQRMSHLKAFQASQHGALSQQLLNEIATARTTLLNPERKQQYDAQLQAETAGSSNPAMPPVRSGRPRPATRRAGDTAANVEVATGANPKRAASADPKSDVPVSVVTQSSTGGRSAKPRAAAAPKKPNRHQFKINVIGHIIAPIVGLMLGYLVLCWLRPEVSIFGSGRDDSGRDDLAVVDDGDVGGETEPDRSDGDNGSTDHGQGSGASVNGDSHKQQPNETDPADGGSGTSSSGTDPGDSPDVTDPDDAGTPTTTTDGTNGDGSNGDGSNGDGSNGGNGEPNDNGGPIVPKEPTLEEKLADLQDRRDKAVSANNVPQALDVIQQIAELKEEDALDAQAAFVEQLHQRASSPAELKTMAKNGLTLIDKAIDEGRAEVAKRLANMTLLAARRADDIALVRQATQRVIAVQELGTN